MIRRRARYGAERFALHIPCKRCKSSKDVCESAVAANGQRASWCLERYLREGTPSNERGSRTAAARRRRRDALIVKAASRDALLTSAEAGALVGGISEQNWPAYAVRWPALREGMRVVRVSGPTSRGRTRWLKSAVLRHIADELLHPDRDDGKRAVSIRKEGQP